MGDVKVHVHVYALLTNHKLYFRNYSIKAFCQLNQTPSDSLLIVIRPAPILPPHLDET